jgi:hypothetical protein
MATQAAEACFKVSYCFSSLLNIKFDKYNSSVYLCALAQFSQCFAFFSALVNLRYNCSHVLYCVVPLLPIAMLN